MINQLKNYKIFIAGHNGMVGTALKKYLIENDVKKIITATRKQLDLQVENQVNQFIKKNKPDIIVNCAGKVGGILANSTYPTEFLYENIYIQANLIKTAYKNKIKHFINLGSSCIYPKNAKQPIKEKYLLSSELEKTNEAYALAKITGVKMCESYNFQYKTNYKCLMPTNLYGPNDNYHKDNSHFFPALIKKIHFAKKNKKKIVTIWGSGKPRREMMFSMDLAEACIYFMNKRTKESLINIGSGIEMTIKQYAEFIAKQLCYKVKFRFDKSKKDGTPRKILDCSLAKKYEWTAKTTLVEGFKKTYSNFLKK